MPGVHVAASPVALRAKQTPHCREEAAAAASHGGEQDDRGSWTNHPERMVEDRYTPSAESRTMVNHSPSAMCSLTGHR